MTIKNILKKEFNKLARSSGVWNRALTLEKASGLPGPAEGPADALRHLVASADATIKYGTIFSRFAGWMIEVVGQNKISSQVMDFNNNAVGVRLAKKFKTMPCVIEAIIESISNGRKCSREDTLNIISRADREEGTICIAAAIKDAPEDWQQKILAAATELWPKQYGESKAQAGTYDA